jgi:hypothetical protein
VQKFRIGGEVQCLAVMFFRACAIALVFLSTGCQYNPYASDFTKKYPNERDLIGTYHLESDPTVRIVLNADKTLTYEKLPDSVFYFNSESSQGKSFTGRGTWTIAKHQEWWELYARVDSFPRDSEGGPVFDLGVHLIGEQPPYKLHITLGDPDLGKALQFKK